MSNLPHPRKAPPEPDDRFEGADFLIGLASAFAAVAVLLLAISVASHYLGRAFA